jgi:plasmid stabilization system protein ParE
MDYEVVWADDAKENYRQVARYLLDAFGFGTADRFTDPVNEKVARLEQSPFLGQRLDGLTAVRRLPLPPYNVLYSSVVGRRITLLNILDGRKPI